MARRAKLINAADTTLNGAINASTTSVVVTDGSIYPSEGDFWITVEDEIMQVTARSTNTLTVVRGVEGSTAASHSDTSQVSTIITSGGLDAYLEESVAWNLHGNAYNAWDGRHVLLDRDDNTIQTSDMNRDGPSTSQINDNPDGSVNISAGAIGILSVQLAYVTAPASTPYTATAHMSMTNPTTVGTSGNYMAFGFRESADTDYLIMIARAVGNVNFAFWTSRTALNTTIDTIPFYAGNDIWFRVTNDGTDLEGFVSKNGRNWSSVGSTPVGTHINPNQICWGGQSRNKTGHDFVLHSLTFT